MSRQPKKDLGSIIQPDKANGFPTPETEPEPTPEPTTPKTRSYPSREGKIPVQFFVDKDAHRQLKIVGAETDKSNQRHTYRGSQRLVSDERFTADRIVPLAVNRKREIYVDKGYR